MLNHKKTAALLMSLLICTSAPIYPTFADNDTNTAVSDEASPAESENKVSGDFTYSLTSSNTVCIEGCSSTAKDLVIPDTLDGITVTELGRMAFGSTEGRPYETITLPASIDYISADGPFSVCGRLREIKVDSSNNNYIAEDGVLYTKDKTEIICYPQQKEGSSYTISEGVKLIDKAAFYHSQLSEVKFPSTLVEIGPFAFGSCFNLTAADLSNTKTDYISTFGFSYCSALSDVKFPETLTEINGGAFAGCKMLTEITLPTKLQTIGQYCFVSTGLKKVEIPSSVTDIQYCAFGYSQSTTGEDIIDSDFLIIGEYGSAAYNYAFDSDADYDYKNDFRFQTPEQHKELSYLEGLTFLTSGDYQYAEIEGGAAIIYCFSEDSVINVPSELDGIKITEIYPAAFSEIKAEEINISEGITTIKKMAFMSCPNLKSVTLPQSVTLIEDNVFDDCAALESVDLGGAVTIGSQVFNYCTALKEITLSGNCTSIGGEDEDPFIYLENLKKINVSDGDGSYTSVDGILYSKDKSVIVHYPKGRTDKKFTVPKGVKAIGNDSFSINNHLEEVDLSHVETIGISAFENCGNLSSVKLSKNLKKVDSGAFYGCKNLKEIRLYTSDTEIGDFAFGYYYDESISNEDGTTGKSALVEGFKLYTKKSKDDTGVDYAEKNNIEAVTGTVDLFGKNIRKELLWVCGGGIFLLIAAFFGSLAIKKSHRKKASSLQINKEKKKTKKNPDENKKETDEKEKNKNEQ